ncbi:E3 ubiquitin-protein ligase RNF144B-like [Ostrea edulis]|uniref:E3 ubiquitin-protein ligase RNF144B-like n=1 Tax=Ostrea edulis TaxID=37623 RepID=UPI0024AEE869|nr:E3 ubiquitin-protein ligase RNF144B-like [Ostrea edulis]
MDSNHKLSVVNKPKPLPPIGHLSFSNLTGSMLCIYPKANTVGECKGIIAKDLNIEAVDIDIVDMKYYLVYSDEFPTSKLPFPIPVLLCNRQRCVENFPSKLKNCISDEEDIVFPEGGEKTVLMSCGHAITPDNLFQYMKVEIMSAKHEIYCYGKTKNICNAKWEFSEIAEKCLLNEDERKFYLERKTMNYINDTEVSGVKKCPTCGCYCTKQNVYTPMVRCQLCAKNGINFMFCWVCLDEWRHDHACSFDQQKALSLCEIQIVLDNCSKITAGYSSVQNVPSRRLCPSCFRLIEINDACKQMFCYFCKVEFCFVCLKIKPEKGDFQCGKFNEPCMVAPVQNVKTLLAN